MKLCKKIYHNKGKSEDGPGKLVVTGSYSVPGPGLWAGIKHIADLPSWNTAEAAFPDTGERNTRRHKVAVEWRC